MSETETKATDTVRCTIDGREVVVPRGTTILHAAEKVGVKVPHYCYHPGIPSRPAMCRMCLVEVEKMPKLQPACVTPVQDGQVVRTEGANARRMRQAVLEFYLLNHPLDCPVCDQSGECKLQDYVFAEGRKHGRGTEPKRVFGRDDFGGDVLFYGDRCVMCTRCVRFMNEIAEDPRLCVVERGDRSIIDTFFEEGLAGSPWAGNIVDICPVGALVSKDFLHKQRAWDLDHTPSICPNCSQGCNIQLHVRDNAVQRLRPRPNLDVNGYWMCDYGRQRYEWMNSGERIEAAMVRESGRAKAVGWPEALARAAEALRGAAAAGVVALASPFHSNEDLAATAALVGALGGGSLLYRSELAANEVRCPGYPGLARRRELAPNGRGAELLGFRRVGDEHASGDLEELTTHGGVLIVLGDPLLDADASFGTGAQAFLYANPHTSAAARHAHFVLPVTTFAEAEGTFTNFAGRLQRFWPGLAAPGMARPAWQALWAIAAALTGQIAPTTAAEAFRRIGRQVAELEGLTYEQIGPTGAPLPASVSGSVR
ncbi:MAG: (2Fe-2S)-binding protein [Gemmatimonadetes bacterium]|nr:(2Fe-2S)-binding protein [Gemmatimonadota bacterium]